MYKSILLFSLLTVNAFAYDNLFFDSFKDNELDKWNIVGPDFVTVDNETLNVSNGALISPRVHISSNNYRVAFDVDFKTLNESFFIGIRADYNWYGLGFYISAENNLINFVKYLPDNKAEVVHTVNYQFTSAKKQKIAINDDGNFITLFIDNRPVMALTETAKAGFVTYIKAFGEDTLNIDNYSIKILKDNSWFGRGVVISNYKQVNPPIYKVPENNSTFSLLCAGFFALIGAKFLISHAQKTNNRRTSR